MSKSAKLILIVDDDAMNRKLTGMFLKKLGYDSKAVASGRDALEAIQTEEFTLVLMDYRMPEMDGVETTRRLRELEGRYFQSVPVIALTGDEREDVRRKFEEVGMQDVLSKPLNAEKLSEALKRWLEVENGIQEIEVVQNVLEAGIEAEQEPQEEVQDEAYIALRKTGINVREGVHNCGSHDLWLSFLKDFYHLIDFKVTKLEKCLSEGQLKEYTIEVHALKNSARLIGATELSNDFGNLEEWGNLEDLKKIEERNPQILEKMLQYKEVLRPFSAEEKDMQDVSATQIKEVLWAMQSAVESFDIDGVDFCMKELERYKIQGCESQMVKLKAYVADVAQEDILTVISEIIGIIEKAE